MLLCWKNNILYEESILEYDHKVKRESAEGDMKMIRRIIEINEEKCNGCGACAEACHEGAIKMVNGKVVDIIEKGVAALAPQEDA